jgi:hypothetical protein
VLHQGGPEGLGACVLTGQVAWIAPSKRRTARGIGRCPDGSSLGGSDRGRVVVCRQELLGRGPCRDRVPRPGVSSRVGRNCWGCGSRTEVRMSRRGCRRVCAGIVGSVPCRGTAGAERMCPHFVPTLRDTQHFLRTAADTSERGSVASTGGSGLVGVRGPATDPQHFLRTPSDTRERVFRVPRPPAVARCRSSSPTPTFPAHSGRVPRPAALRPRVGSRVRPPAAAAPYSCRCDPGCRASARGRRARPYPTR